MFNQYLRTAMHHAKYEILPEDGTFYGEISKCNGVYANAPTLEKCREELEEVLEEWLLFRISQSLPIPKIDGIALKVKKVA